MFVCFHLQRTMRRVTRFPPEDFNKDLLLSSNCNICARNRNKLLYVRHLIRTTREKCESADSVDSRVGLEDFECKQMRDVCGISSRLGIVKIKIKNFFAFVIRFFFSKLLSQLFPFALSRARSLGFFNIIFKFTQHWILPRHNFYVFFLSSSSCSLHRVAHCARANSLFNLAARPYILYFHEPKFVTRLCHIAVVEREN